ncbi:MAG: ATP synthase F0 subunit B [Candidatus Amoebophilus sp. 36-38]|nr:MAG: ATP synthase F0 subunit B [Candidatus Amoebophilus sp. 36-38]
MELITPDFGIIFWQTIILLFVLFILGKFAWKPILQTLQQRERNIEEALKGAQEAKEILAQMKAEQDQLLENSSREREKMANEAIVTKNSILEAAKIEAQHLSDKVLRDARETIEVEKTMAFDKLKHEIGVISIQVAEKLLAKELNKENKQEDLVRRLVKETHLN